MNIGREGTRTMDLASHLNPIDIIGVSDDSTNSTATTSSCSSAELLMAQVEAKLRPISGIRNHLKRNHSAHFSTRDRDLLRETDLCERLSTLRHSLRRLDLSHNNLRVYPLQLCSLYMLESLNLSSNHLTEVDFPAELELLQNLSELILDNNSLKFIPKSLTR